MSSAVRADFEQAIAATYVKQLEDERKWEQLRLSREPVANTDREAYSSRSKQWGIDRIQIAQRYWDRAIESIGGTRAEALRASMRPTDLGAGGRGPDRPVESPPK